MQVVRHPVAHRVSKFGENNNRSEGGGYGHAGDCATKCDPSPPWREIRARNRLTFGSGSLGGMKVSLDCHSVQSRGAGQSRIGTAIASIGIIVCFLVRKREDPGAIFVACQVSDISRFSKMRQIQDLHVRAMEPLVSPRALKDEFPADEKLTRIVADARDTVRAILAGGEPRILCIVGPCSIHDSVAAMEYAERLARLSREVADQMFVMM